MKEQVSTLATSSGAKASGYKSATTTQREKDVKSADVEYQKHLASEPGKYLWLIKDPKTGKPIIQTGNVPPKGTKSSKNPVWSKWDSLTGELKKTKGEAESNLQNSKTSDSQETVPTEKPPTGVGSVGSVKGKKKKDEPKKAKAKTTD